MINKQWEGTHTYRILAIDDDPLSTELTKLALEETGRYLVCEINDPQTAVAGAREFAPDLVVMDMDMPHLDGRAAALLIQCEEGLKEVPILFVTSRIAEDQGSGSNPFGWFGPLAKPVSPQRLARVVENILQHQALDSP